MSGAHVRPEDSDVVGEGRRAHYQRMNKVFRTAILSPVVVAAAVACSSSEADTPSPSPSATTSVTATPTATVPSVTRDASVADSASPDAAAKAPSLAGKFKAACRFSLEVQGTKLYETNELEGTDTTYTMNVSLFLDPACSTKFVTLGEKATYVVRATARPDGASELDVTRSAMTMTAHHPAALPMLDNGKCGAPPWSVAQTQDVYAGGCGVAGFAPAAVCTKDFDLLKVSGDRFSFGKRPADNDLCTQEKRPSELSNVEFVRQP